MPEPTSHRSKGIFTKAGQAARSGPVIEEKLPTVIASSVVRSTQQGESHGGVYLIDMDKESYQQVIDWNDPTISWEGRGADRGLRGIAFWKDHIYLAASNEIFIFNQSFEIVDSLTNPYLNHCHEIDVCGDYLYLTSTGFDSILEVDLSRRQFTRGFMFRMPSWRYLVTRAIRRFGMKNLRICPFLHTFDPNERSGPEQGDQLHINSVVAQPEGLFVSGRSLGCLLHVNIDTLRNEQIIRHWSTPFGTHNVALLEKEEGSGYMLMNDTDNDSITMVGEQGRVVSTLPLPKYDENNLERNNIPKDHARQAFGRGLCQWGEDIAIVGSSPATVSAYSLSTAKRISSVNLTMDVRNAIHGLEVWPF